MGMYALICVRSVIAAELAWAFGAQPNLVCLAHCCFGYGSSTTVECFIQSGCVSCYYEVKDVKWYFESSQLTDGDNQK